MIFKYSIFRYIEWLAVLINLNLFLELLTALSFLQISIAVADHSGHICAFIVELLYKDKIIFLLERLSLVPEFFLHIWKDDMAIQQAMFEMYFSNNALLYFFFGFGE